jgi:hypothetical protein
LSASWLDKHQRRWAYSYKAIAGATYVLDPEFHEHEQHKNTEVMTGFNDTVEKIAILEVTRKRVRACTPSPLHSPLSCLAQPLTDCMSSCCATHHSSASRMSSPRSGRSAPA